MTEHEVVSRDEWNAARATLLAREKEHTRLGDELVRERRELPWLQVEKDYALETDTGTRTLAELFDERRQLLVYRFMFGPSYEAGCPACTSIADGVTGLIPHLNDGILDRAPRGRDEDVPQIWIRRHDEYAQTT
jgi:predicted dithiol-disulfide oxidoreductase (DUF899 family)